MPQRSRYALPAVIEPASERCFIVHVPNDQNYIAAFKGALYDLTKAYVWGNDANHTALLAAARMLTMWVNLQEIDCMAGQQTQIEFDPQCGLRWSYDGGATWNTATFDICAQTWAENAIQNALNDGTIPKPGGQPGPSNPPAPGACKTYHVALNANNQWHCPSPIQSGDSVHITNAHGGWSDGTANWYCPDGKSYYLGNCAVVGQHHEAGDPLNPGAFHMALVGSFGATYFDPLTSLYTVPPGIPATDMFIQANDSPLSDDAGQVEFDVTVCSGMWTQHFDFRASNGGFSNVRVGGAGVYVLGTGWASSPWLSTQQIQVQLAVSSCHILGIRMAGTLTNNYLSDAGVQNQSGFMMRHLGLTGATFDISDTVDVAGVTLIFIYNWQHQDGTHDNMAHTVTDLWITGTGNNPFA